MILWRKCQKCGEWFDATVLEKDEKACDDCLKKERVRVAESSVVNPQIPLQPLALQAQA